MICPHCNAANADEARFCGGCGKTMSATEPVSGANPPSYGTDMSAMIGREIAGRYRIQSKLGEGGMGAVFKAEQISLKRTVAVKLLRPDVSLSPMILRRFNAEAEAVAKLSHPNTVNIYDFGQDTDGSLFIAMEYIEGRSLRSVVQTDAPLPIRRMLTIAQQVAASLTDAHAHKIIHRDLKPDNVMLQDRGKQRDIVRVLDFGIAKLRDEGRATQQMTQAGDMLGTPQYMAPEQIRAEGVDGRVDVYALGCMMYECVTAHMPFEAPTLMALLSKHLMEQAPPPSQRRRDLQIPPWIDELIMTAMAKDAAARPPNMEAFGERIANALAMLPPEATALRSAVVPVPATTPVSTPGGFGAAQMHATPQHFAQTPPPYPQTPAPGYVPTPPPPGIGTPSTPVPVGQPMGPPMQYPTPYPPAPHAAPGGGGSKVGLWIVLGLVVLGGVGAAIFFATKKSGGSAGKDGGSEIVDDDKKDPDDDKSDGDPKVDAAMKKLKGFRDQICACTDKDCVQRVSTSLTEWGKEIGTSLDAKSTPEVKAKAQALGKEIGECMVKIMQKEGLDVPQMPTLPTVPDEDDPWAKPQGGASSTVRTTPRPATPAKPRDASLEINRMADRACRCSNATCAKLVVDGFVTWVNANISADGDEHNAEVQTRRLLECAVKAGLSQTDLQTALSRMNINMKQ